MASECQERIEQNEQIQSGISRLAPLLYYITQVALKCTKRLRPRWSTVALMGQNSTNRQHLNCTSNLWNMELRPKAVQFDSKSNPKRCVHTDSDESDA